MPVEAAELARDLGTEVDNVFDADRSGGSAGSTPAADGPGLSGGQWSGSGGGGGDEDAADLEAYVAAQESFSEFLTRQAMVALPDPGDRLIAAALIDGLDEAGYFRGDLAGGRRDARRPGQRGSSGCWRRCRRWSRPACSPAISPNA